jgi:ABC-type branched-subunit amino acid transport system permease subunit
MSGPAAAPATWIAPIAALAVFAALPFVFSDWIVFLIALALAKGAVVLGVVLLLRAGLISFGHALYFATGAYTVGFLANKFNIGEALIALPLAVIISALVAALLGLLLARFRGIYFAMLSLALSMILYTALAKFYEFSGGTDGLSIRGFTVGGVTPANPGLVQYYLVLVLTTIVAFTCARFVASPTGYLTQAVRYNEIRIEYLGASASHAILSSYVLSGAISGLGGALVAYLVGHVSPDFSYWVYSGDFVFVAVLGGTGSVLAPFVGSIAFEFVKNYAVKFSPHTWQLTLGVFLLLVIYFQPQGLWHLIARFRARPPRAQP